jgi:hypothetical protein
MIDFEFDPEETVEWAGVGDLTLRTAVRRIMALSPENCVAQWQGRVAVHRTLASP